MKNLLAALSLLFAAGIPGTLLAEFLGLRLPVVLGLEDMVGAFAIAVTLLTVVADYARPTKPLVVVAPSPMAHVAQFPRAELPERLAA